MQTLNLYGIISSYLLLYGDAPDGAPASIQTAIGTQAGIALDDAGNLYIADAGNFVRMVPKTTGTYFGKAMIANHIYKIAGSAFGPTNVGYSGDNGPATSALLNNPNTSPAFDSKGNVFFSDGANRRIRVICRVSGTYFGQAMIANNIYSVVGNGTYGSSPDGTEGTQALFDIPYQIAIDKNDNLFWNDRPNSSIRIMPQQSGTYFGRAMAANRVYTIAGNGSAGFSGDDGPAINASASPRHVATDLAGNVYFSDGLTRIRMVAAVPGTFFNKTTTTGNIYTIAGTGVSTSGADGNPAISTAIRAVGITFDRFGNLYFTDGSPYQKVRVIPNQICQ
jgi:hypothetical protein